MVIFRHLQNIIFSYDKAIFKANTAGVFGRICPLIFPPLEGYLPACSFLSAEFINYCSSFAIFSPSGNSRWIFPVFYVFYTKMLDIDAIFRNLQIYFSSKYPFFCFLSSFCTKCTTFSFSITFLAPFRIVCSRPAFELHLPGIYPVFSPFTPLKAVF